MNTQVFWDGKIHKVEYQQNDHIVTNCGISTWVDLHPLTQDEVVTCDLCNHLTRITFADDWVIKSDDKELYKATSFSDAREWCYARGAKGFTVRNDIATTKIYLK